MTLNELKGKYNRISQEIDSLAGCGERQQARLARLMNELDDVHRELSLLRRRTASAPTLRDIVSMPQVAASAAPMPQAA